MRKINTLLAAVLIATTASFATPVSAAQIVGNLTIGGGAIFNTADLGTATAVSSFSNTKVESSDGDFAAISVNTLVTITAYTFNPSGPVANLFSVGGFTFDLSSSSIAYQNSIALVVEGEGTFTGNGFDATPGVFNFSSQKPSSAGIFSFSASAGNASNVPDGGATVLMLGGALGLLGVARRKLSFAK